MSQEGEGQDFGTEFTGPPRAPLPFAATAEDNGVTRAAPALSSGKAGPRRPRLCPCEPGLHSSHRFPEPRKLPTSLPTASAGARGAVPGQGRFGLIANPLPVASTVCFTQRGFSTRLRPAAVRYAGDIVI